MAQHLQGRLKGESTHADQAENSAKGAWQPAVIDMPGCPYSPFRVFGDLASASEHIAKHLLGAEEANRWKFVIPAIIEHLGDIGEDRERHRLYNSLRREEVLKILYELYCRSIELNLQDACKLGWYGARRSGGGWVGVALGTSGVLIVAEHGVIVTAFLPKKSDGGGGEPGGRRHRMRGGKAPEHAPERHTQRWCAAEWLYYRVFRPALQFVRRAVYEPIPPGVDPNARRNDYWILKDCVPVVRSVKYDDWVELRQTCRGGIYNNEVN